MLREMNNSKKKLFMLSERIKKGKQTQAFSFMAIVQNSPDMADMSPQYIVFWVSRSDTLKKGVISFSTHIARQLQCCLMYGSDISANMV